MLLGSQHHPQPQHQCGPFEKFPMGTKLQIGVDSSFWVGRLASFEDGAIVLTEAQLFANVGKPVHGIVPVVRIPIKFVTFVGQILDHYGEDRKDQKCDQNSNSENQGKDQKNDKWSGCLKKVKKCIEKLL